MDQKVEAAGSRRSMQYYILTYSRLTTTTTTRRRRRDNIHRNHVSETDVKTVRRTVLGS